MARLERRRGRRRCRRGALWEAPHTGSAPGRPPSPGAENLAARPGVALIPAPACQQRRSVARGSWPRAAGAPDGPGRKMLWTRSELRKLLGGTSTP